MCSTVSHRTFSPLQTIRRQACDCLKWKYKANRHLENGNIRLAIEAYNQSLDVACESLPEQEGVLLLLRASAYLKQAQTQKQQLQDTVFSQNWNNLPDRQKQIQALLFHTSRQAPEKTGLSASVLHRLSAYGKLQHYQWKQVQFLHGLYQDSLLHATQDSLRATEVLPHYSTSWLKAGEVLGNLWKLRESKQYLERAMSMDESLSESLQPVFREMDRKQDLLERAKEQWNEDSLRLALDLIE